MRKRYWLLVFMVIAFAAEYFLSWKFYRSIVPFPEMEFWYTAVSSFLRDVLLLGVAGLLYLRQGETLFSGSCNRRFVPWRNGVYGASAAAGWRRCYCAGNTCRA